MRCLVKHGDTAAAAPCHFVIGNLTTLNIQGDILFGISLRHGKNTAAVAHSGVSGNAAAGHSEGCRSRSVVLIASGGGLTMIISNVQTTRIAIYWVALRQCAIGLVVRDRTAAHGHGCRNNSNTAAAVGSIARDLSAIHGKTTVRITDHHAAAVMGAGGGIVPNHCPIIHGQGKSGSTIDTSTPEARTIVFQNRASIEHHSSSVDRLDDRLIRIQRGSTSLCAVQNHIGQCQRRVGILHDDHRSADPITLDGGTSQIPTLFFCYRVSVGQIN